MAYKALYRTYRPASFEEIAGQEHITKTFKNALKNNKIAHAYLFSGPRGTGKTSIAKIIAKAVNCEQAPVDDPCNECEICKGIDNNTINDVIEIDAASNNGVDEIREIRDKVKYLPGVGKYKVYIIDEVHMLSTGAFNALLKTLEEPPKHVIFILATTEPHKIPATIHSRCQRFDFRGVSVGEMLKRLHTIIQEEKIDVDQEALKVIAESAEGGMRDAISLLDQVVSYTDKQVTVEDVHDIKGTVSNQRLLTIAAAIYDNNSIDAINQMDDLINLGKESPRLVENLIQFYRDMLVFKNVDHFENEQLIYQDETFVELAGKISNNLLFFYIDVLNKAQQDMKWTNNSKLYMELALIKMVDKVEKQELVFEDEIISLQKTIQELHGKVIELEEQMEQSYEQRTMIKEPEVQQQVPVETKVVEEPVEDDVVQNNDVVTEEAEVQEKPEVEEETSIFDYEEPEVQKEPYKTFDIRFVEDVLNDANREVKIAMNKRWFDIEREASNADMAYAKMITEGRLVATNGELIIIEYPTPAVCNKMMKPDVREKITTMLSDFFKTTIDYMALPTVVWQEKSQEFIKRWRQGETNIKLSPIDNPNLRDIQPTNRDYSDMTPDSVKEAVNIFGYDTVKVKKGDK